MNARTYALNTEAAKSADQMGNRITETGKYIGKFVSAEAITSTKQTEGVEFSFLATDGRSADFLTLWTYNNEGKELFGLKTLNALMTCMRVKNIAPQPGTVQKWENGGKVTKQTTIFPDLMSKPIGVLLQREPYEKKDGSTGYKFNIYAAFDAASEMMASEILDKSTKADKLGKLVAGLTDRKMSAPMAPAGPQGAPAGHFDDLDQDIPF